MSPFSREQLLRSGPRNCGQGAVLAASFAFAVGRTTTLPLARRTLVSATSRSPVTTLFSAPDFSAPTLNEQTVNNRSMGNDIRGRGMNDSDNEAGKYEGFGRGRLAEESMAGRVA